MNRKTFQIFLLSFFPYNVISMNDKNNKGIEFSEIINSDFQENIFRNFSKLSDFMGIFLTNKDYYCFVKSYLNKQENEYNTIFFNRVPFEDLEEFGESVNKKYSLNQQYILCEMLLCKRNFNPFLMLVNYIADTCDASIERIFYGFQKNDDYHLFIKELKKCNYSIVKHRVAVLYCKGGHCIEQNKPLGEKLLRGKSQNSEDD